jgi:putative transposase
MQLTAQHVIDHKDPCYKLIDDTAFKSKNLYNATLYEVRQAFIHQGIYLDYHEMDKRMQLHEAYQMRGVLWTLNVLELWSSE